VQQLSGKTGRTSTSIGAASRVRYVSTRGEAPPLGFVDAMLAGLARDGGLYVPEAWPQLDAHSVAGFAGKPYPEVAVEVMRPFAGEAILDHDLARMAREAYGGFRHAAVAPLVQFGASNFLLELFHGPTLAFKDLALQFLARVMDHVLTLRGEHATLVVATSGDTGAAAIEAFRGRTRVDVFVLFPLGRISDVQRRMMTTRADENVHVLAIEGTFDDCQAMLKAMFNHHAFCDRVRLSGVNSINWARIIAQVVYYFTSAAALGAPHRKLAYTVPTGNFGNIYAGYIAVRMGLPIDRLVIATNINDILTRTIATGTYELRNVAPTSSPSMDIQVASNFERLLFELYDRDGGAVRELMAKLAQFGGFSLSNHAVSEMRGLFSADRADEAETAATIRTMLRETGELIDPHTAVGVAVSEKETRDPAIPMIVLSTAHPAKFPDAVQAACGVRPALPDWLGDLGEQPERVTVLPVDQSAIENLVLCHSRAAQAGAAA
jgi:threonine synthase